MKLIGISGVARSGKDLFTTVAQEVLKQHGLKTERFALAYELKSDLKDLIHTKTGIDVFTENTEEKNIIRPLLVAYGDVMRKITEGKYWTQKVEQRLGKSNADVVFITDIRYDHYIEDECAWLQNKQSGKLIHVTKYVMSPMPQGKRFSKNKQVKVYQSAPNEHESLNDPKVRKRSDLKIEWEDVSSQGGDITKNATIVKIVTDALTEIKVLSNLS
jgi:hypothetical protein